jgi:hypothetical protein
MQSSGFVGDHAGLKADRIYCPWLQLVLVVTVIRVCDRLSMAAVQKADTMMIEELAADVKESQGERSAYRSCLSHFEP